MRLDTSIPARCQGCGGRGELRQLTLVIRGKVAAALCGPCVLAALNIDPTPLEPLAEEATV
jgi:hypothetical protein